MGFYCYRLGLVGHRETADIESGSVSRVLCPPFRGGGDHLSWPVVAGRLSRRIGKRPTRRSGERTHLCSGRVIPAAWSCRRWGLPCRGCHQSRGALLPHHFTFACAPIEIGAIGRVFSVALSLGLPPVAISHHRCPVLLGLSSRLKTGERPPDPLSMSIVSGGIP